MYNLKIFIRHNYNNHKKKLNIRIENNLNVLWLMQHKSVTDCFECYFFNIIKIYLVIVFFL